MSNDKDRMIKKLQSAFEDWGREWNKENSIFYIDTELQDCTYDGMRLVIAVEDEHVVTYAVTGLCANAKQRPSVAEFIIRLNYGRLCGQWEMDYDDGEIRFAYVLPHVAFKEDALSALKEVEMVCKCSWLMYANALVTFALAPSPKEAYKALHEEEDEGGDEDGNEVVNNGDDANNDNESDDDDTF